MGRKKRVQFYVDQSLETGQTPKDIYIFYFVGLYMLKILFVKSF